MGNESLETRCWRLSVRRLPTSRASECRRDHCRHVDAGASSPAPPPQPRDGQSDRDAQRGRAQRVLFLLVFYFQGVRGYDPVTAGILLAPLAVGMLVLSPISGALADRYGSRELATAGMIVTAMTPTVMVSVFSGTQSGAAGNRPRAVHLGTAAGVRCRRRVLDPRRDHLGDARRPPILGIRRGAVEGRTNRLGTRITRRQ